MAALRVAIRRRFDRWYKRVGWWTVLAVLGAGAGIFWLSTEIHQQRFGTTLLKLNYDQWQGLTKALDAGFELGSLLLWLGATAVICGCYCALLREWPNPSEAAMRRALYLLLLGAAAAVWLLLILASIMPLLLPAWRQGLLITPLAVEVALQKGQQYLMEFLQPAVWLLALAALTPTRLLLVWIWSIPLLLAPKVRDLVCAIIEAATGNVYGRNYLQVPLAVFLDQIHSPWDYDGGYLSVATGLQWHWLAGGACVLLTLVAFRLRIHAAAYVLLAVCTLSAAWLLLIGLLPGPIEQVDSRGYAPSQAYIKQAVRHSKELADSRWLAVTYGSGPAIFTNTQLATYYERYDEDGMLVLSAPVSRAEYEYPRAKRHVSWSFNLGWVLLCALFVVTALLGSWPWPRDTGSLSSA